MIHSSIINLITKPTRVTESSQTAIDHILANDSESRVTPGILIYSMSDYYSTFSKIATPHHKKSKLQNPISHFETLNWCGKKVSNWFGKHYLY